MIELKVRKTEMCSAAEGMQSVAADMQDLRDQVEAVRGALQFHSGMISIRGSLWDLSRRMERQGAFSKKLGEQQVVYATMYEAAETNVTAQLDAQTELAGRSVLPAQMPIAREELEKYVSAVAVEFGQDNIAADRNTLEEIIAVLEEFLKTGVLHWSWEMNRRGDMTIMLLFEVLAQFSLNSKAFGWVHHSKNKTTWSSHKQNSGGYIEDQNDLNDMRYGARSMDKNGCGVIAIYNAIMSLSDDKAAVKNMLPGLVSLCEMSGIAFDGAGGTAPFEISNLFKGMGYESKIITCNGNPGRISRMESDYETFILLAANNKVNPFKGYHYISITKEPQGYQLHNASKQNCYYATLEEAINAYKNGNSEPISLIGVRK